MGKRRKQKQKQSGYWIDPVEDFTHFHMYEEEGEEETQVITRVYGSHTGAKKVVVVGNLEVWAGPFSEARSVKPDLYISLNGEVIRPVVRDFGLGLDFKPKEPKGLSIDWPDFGVPELPREFWEALAKRLQEEEGKLFIGCDGGQGRTGTALAILAYFWGLTNTPIAWVREAYLRLAVETDAQARYVGEITGTSEDLQGALDPRPASVHLVGSYGGYGAYRKSADKVYDISVVERVVSIVVNEVKADALRDEQGTFLFDIEEDEEGYYIRGLVGEIEIRPPSVIGGQWAVYLWDSSKVRTEQPQILSYSALLREFLVRENAIVELAMAADLSPEYFSSLSYGDIWGLALNEKGEFVTDDGRELTPIEAAAYLMGKE